MRVQYVPLIVIVLGCTEGLYWVATAGEEPGSQERDSVKWLIEETLTTWGSPANWVNRDLGSPAERWRGYGTFKLLLGAVTGDERAVEHPSNFMVSHGSRAGGGLIVFFIKVLLLDLVGRAGGSSAALPQIKNPSSPLLLDNPQWISRISSHLL